MHKIEGLYIGDITTLEPGGDRTGIFKQAVSRVMIQSDGLVGDHQADRRFHGGPDKAVHQFSERSYQLMIESFPHLSEQLISGAMGENLSAHDMTDEDVLIGDVYRVGEALLQVSEPRRPCWKINAKFSEETLSKFVESNAISGWYYRVIEAGDVAVGDVINLVERFRSNPSVATFHRTVTQHRPPIADLQTLLECETLNRAWRKKITERVKFLNTHPD